MFFIKIFFPSQCSDFSGIEVNSAQFLLFAFWVDFSEQTKISCLDNSLYFWDRNNVLQKINWLHNHCEWSCAFEGIPLEPSINQTLQPVQFLCYWLVKIWQVSSRGNLYSILKLVYFDSWSWQSFVSTCDVFNCLFPLDVQNEIQLLSRVFCYSWLVCVLNFWLRNASLVKVSFRFRMASFSFITLLVTKEGWIVSSRDSGVSC